MENFRVHKDDLFCQSVPTVDVDLQAGRGCVAHFSLQNLGGRVRVGWRATRRRLGGWHHGDSTEHGHASGRTATSAPQPKHCQWQQSNERPELFRFCCRPGPRGNLSCHGDESERIMCGEIVFFGVERTARRWSGRGPGPRGSRPGRRRGGRVGAVRTDGTQIAGNRP